MDEEILPAPQATDDFIKENDLTGNIPRHHPELKSNSRSIIPKDKLARGDISNKIPVRIDDKTTVMLDPEKAKVFDKNHWTSLYYHRKEQTSHGRIIRTINDEPKTEGRDTESSTEFTDKG
jgi:hypothetical protein